jgi:alkyl sulfatase BDS1-like metallo-beta-lactamase superfamily hydrolase
MTLNTDFTDINEQYVLTVENGVLNYTKGKQADKADATLTTTRAALDQVVLGEADSSTSSRWVKLPLKGAKRN